MNTTTILGLSLAVVFAVSITGIAFAAGNPIATSASVTRQGTWTAIVNTDSPATPNGADYGFAVFGEKGAVVITSHPDAVDSVAQPPVEAFHTHLVTVEHTGECSSNLAVATATKNEVGHLSIDGNTITVTNIPDGLTGQLSNHVVSFDISLENGRVCVNPTGDINP